MLIKNAAEPATGWPISPCPLTLLSVGTVHHLPGPSMHSQTYMLADIIIAPLEVQGLSLLSSVTRCSTLMRKVVRCRMKCALVTIRTLLLILKDAY